MNHRIVRADLPACDQLRRHALLAGLMTDGARVLVSNPESSSGRVGVIIGLADHPVMILRDDTGERRVLPQAFTVAELEPGMPDPTPAGRWAEQEHARRVALLGEAAAEDWAAAVVDVAVNGRVPVHAVLQLMESAWQQGRAAEKASTPE
jgi:hypothetical protein